MAEEIYQQKNVPIFEAIYGEGFISLGGASGVEKMFEGFKLDDKKVLDIGFGIGGMAQLLAKKFKTNVLGLEIHEWMASYAFDKADETIKDRLTFLTYKADGNFPIDNESIDLVVSKGVLTNVKGKKKLLSEVHRVLKGNGEILFIDWLVPEAVGAVSTTLTMGDESHKETKSSYQDILENCGFSNIEFLDVSNEYLEYVEELNARFKSKDHIEQYKEIIDEDLRGQLVESNNKLFETIKNGSQLSFKIRGVKN